MQTIEEIARRNKEAGGKYFDKDTLSFFNQKLSDFRVIEFDDRTFVKAVSKDAFGIHWSIAEILDSGRTTSPSDEDREEIMKL